jgi:hypothetical protein
LEDVVSIATGQGLSIALKSDGTVSVLGGKYFKLAEYARKLKDIAWQSPPWQAAQGNLIR